MLNMQQTILNQVPGTEQPQEEVQLTELLPVKQSRIRENSIFKDTDATDALKVLRSFTGNCNDEQEYQLEDYDFCDKTDRREQKRGQRKKNRKCKNEAEDPEAEHEEKNSQADKKPIKRKIRTIGKRDVGRKTLKKKVKAIKRRENAAERSESPTEANGKDGFESDEEILSECDDEQEATYLDSDKSKDFNDEIYVFRREALDSCSTPDPERENGSPENAEGVYKNSTTDGALFDRPSPRREKKVGGAVDNKENESNSNSESALEDSEKELSLNIDAIIQANYLLEHENNNVVQPNQNKVQEQSSAEEELGSSNKEKRGPAKKDAISCDGQQKKYCCIVCDARFKGSGGLRNHYKIVHGAGPVFKCDECGKEFPLKERLKLHVRTHTGFKPYKCLECDKSFARGGQLVQHRRTHSQIKPYRCTLCSGTFTCAANLALHVKRHNGQKDHKCEICGRAFVRRDALKKHMECLHQDVKSFLCVICNKTFKGHLPQHMRTHARDRPHGCATCGQRFAQKSQLTVHQRTHSGQRPFRCLVCWQAFAHSTALKLHTRRHTGERPFKCAECNAGFTQLPHWKKHMKCIHGRNEPYCCKRCNSFFRIKNDLEYHERTCHPGIRYTVEEISSSAASNDGLEKEKVSSLYRVMTVERMRLLLAVLLKRISKQERLDELGFGKRLIDEVLHDSLISAGKDPVTREGLSELQYLTKNLEIFLQWTVPKEHWDKFRKLNKTPAEILETLTAT